MAMSTTITIPGGVTVEIETVKRLIAEAEAPQPIEGQVYRRAEKTDSEPFGEDGQWQLMRYLHGFWKVQSKGEKDWKPGYCKDEIYTKGVREGVLVLYTPPPPLPTFQVGQWAITTGDGIDVKAARITKIDGDMVYRKHPDGDWWTYAHQLRLATPEEIATATRIQPKENMLLRRHSDNAVLFIRRASKNTGYWVYDHLTDCTRGECLLPQLNVSSEDYTVLKSYLIEGAEP